MKITDSLNNYYGIMTIFPLDEQVWVDRYSYLLNESVTLCLQRGVEQVKRGKDKEG